MGNDLRDPRLIQEELSDLQALMREEDSAIAKYPEHTELLILHDASLERERYLFQEFEDSLKWFGIYPFDIVFSGEAVRKNGVQLAFLGRAVSSLQDILGLISQKTQSISSAMLKKRGQIIGESESLYLVGTRPGSFGIILSGQQPAIGTSLAYLALDHFNQLLDCKDNEDLLKEQMNILGYKTIIRYKQFLEILYRNESNVKFYDKIIPEGFNTKEITSELAKDIHDVLGKVEIIPDEEILLRGTLKGISLISHWFEFLVEESEERIKGSFDQKLEPDVKAQFDRTLIAKFRVSKQWVEMKEKFNKKYELIGFEIK